MKAKRTPPAFDKAVTFDDGTTHEIPQREIARQMIEQAARMFCSSEPNLRAAGRRRLHLFADAAAGGALQFLRARWHGKQGGRPSTAEEEDAWLEEYERRMKWDAGASGETICRDIAEDIKHRDGGSVAWTRIRDGISAARKRRVVVKRGV